MRCEARCAPGGGRAWGGGGGASGACTGGRPDSRLGGARARAERTEIMLRMVVTLEVSKLSGWLNAYAFCRVEGRGTCDAGRGAGREAGGPVVWWRHTRGMHGDGPTQGLGAKGTRGAHPEHASHARDVGRVKAQRLVERERGLPNRREGHAMWGEVRAGRREGVGRRRRKRHPRGRPDIRLGRARARAERT